MASGIVYSDLGQVLYSDTATQVSDLNMTVASDADKRLRCFLFGGSAQHNPRSGSSGFGFVYMTSNNYGVQIAFINPYIEMWIRKLEGGTWSSWGKITPNS